nr:MAG TPA: ATP-dependent helicase [Bacteriophage sp.]
MIPQDTPKKIAYIGPNDITSKIPTAIKFNNIKELQGQEFDYLIYEGNIKAQTREYDDTAVGDLLNSSRELYTLISRGIKGAVIISPNSGFTSTEEFYTGDTTDFS